MAEESNGRPRWQPGEIAVLRYITTRDGIVGATWPCRVVADRDDLVALYVAEGSIYKEWQPSAAAPDRRLDNTRWRSDALRLMVPDRGCSIWAVWHPGEERRFRGYYVNFEEPFRRTSIGFDTNDQTLDIVVTPELRWSWKDAEDFGHRVRTGIYSAAFRDAVHAEAERVIAAIESNDAPFCDGWERWAPDPAWAMPHLPATWESEPVKAWSQRRWAYPRCLEAMGEVP